MSDFIADSVTRLAKKEHTCSYCGERIDAKTTYIIQSVCYDGRWGDNKYHPECFTDLTESGECEFTPFSNERPK